MKYDVHAIKATLKAAGILCSVTNGSGSLRGHVVVNIDPRQSDDKVYRDRMVAGAILDETYPDLPKAGSWFLRRTRVAMLVHKPCAELLADGTLAPRT